MSEMWFLRLIKNWTLSTCGLKLYHLGKVCFSGRLAVLYPFYQNCAYLGNEMSQSTFQSCCLCRQSEEVKPCFPHSACNPIRGFVLWNYPTKGNRASAFRLPFLCLCSDNSLLIKHLLRKARAENKGLRKLLKKINQGRELMARARMGIECCLLFSRYLFQYGASKPAAPSGEIVSFHEGLRKGSTAYTYPAKGELKVLTLDFMCYDGNSVLCHLRNEKGERLKMRMWPKNHFQPLCGSMNFVNSQFSIAGSRWLCAYGKMHSGFIELICAIPAPDWFAPLQDITHVDNAQASSSLESLINDAEIKKGG